MKLACEVVRAVQYVRAACWFRMLMELSEVERGKETKGAMRSTEVGCLIGSGAPRKQYTAVSDDLITPAGEIYR